MHDQFVHMNIQLGRQAWPYFDDFFFYGDLAFAVVFTCLGWACWAACSASRLHCIHVSSCCSTAAASVMKPALALRVEMMIRQFYLGIAFFRYALNWLDFLVVCSSWVELFAAGLPINPTFLRMLRLRKCLSCRIGFRCYHVRSSCAEFCMFIYSYVRWMIGPTDPIRK